MAKAVATFQSTRVAVGGTLGVGGSQVVCDTETGRKIPVGL